MFLDTSDTEYIYFYINIGNSGGYALADFEFVPGDPSDTSTATITTKASMMTAKDNQKLYKGQIKDRSRIRVKKELPNNDISSFRSLYCDDPYGN